MLTSCVVYWLWRSLQPLSARAASVVGARLPAEI
jgi:hypothetical protein